MLLLRLHELTQKCLPPGLALVQEVPSKEPKTNGDDVVRTRGDEKDGEDNKGED